MSRRTIPFLAASLALAACEQQEQQLPFDISGAEVTQTVPATGGTVSTAQGASVTFPAGAVAQATAVTLTPVAQPAASASGAPVGTASFRLAPEGTVLQKPAEVALKLGAVSGADAWLASVVNVTPTGVQELGNTRVDLSTGIAQARVSTLGTLALVRPDPRAVVHLRRAGARAAVAPLASVATATDAADSISVSCGDPDNRCSGLLLEASDNLASRVEDAAAVYPLITGVLRISGGKAAGKLTLRTSFRAKLRSGQTAENVDVDARVEPTAATTVSETATQIGFTSMHYWIGGTNGAESRAQQIVATLQVPVTGNIGSLAITRTFSMRNDAGKLEDAWVRVTFPVRIHR